MLGYLLTGKTTFTGELGFSSFFYLNRVNRAIILIAC